MTTTTTTGASRVDRADSDSVCEDDDADSHKDIDFQVKTERVLAVLDNTIQRAQLAVRLPGGLYLES